MANPEQQITLSEDDYYLFHMMVVELKRIADRLDSMEVSYITKEEA